MTYQVEKYPNEPIIVFTLSADFTVEHMALSNAEGHKIFDAVTEPHFMINNLLEFKWNSFNEVIESSNNLADNETSPWRHPNLRQVVLVTQNDLTQMAAEGMNSEMFDNMDIAVFPTMDEALAYVRSQG